MTDASYLNLDAVLDVENDHYRTELVALFKSCAINPIIANSKNSFNEIKILADNGCKQIMFISDTISELQLKNHELIPSIKIENIMKMIL